MLDNFLTDKDSWRLRDVILLSNTKSNRENTSEQRGSFNKKETMNKIKKTRKSTIKIDEISVKHNEKTPRSFP